MFSKWSAVHCDGAFGGRIKSKDHPHRGGFAGTVRTEEPGDNARLHSECEIVDGNLVTITFSQIQGFNHGGNVLPHDHHWIEMNLILKCLLLFLFILCLIIRRRNYEHI